jgi:hypothetical protein
MSTTYAGNCNGFDGDRNLNVMITATTSIDGRTIYNGPPGTLTPGGFLQTAIGPRPDPASVERVRKALEELSEEKARMKARQEAPPMHWWIPDRSGHVCAVCDWDNIYRGIKDAHMPLIKEDREAEDWWRELGAA